MNMRAPTITLCAAGLLMGVVAEGVAFDWDQPLLWLPDLAVGMSFILAGAVTPPQNRGARVLLVAIGFAWFAGTIAPLAIYWHRGPLIHLLVTYPDARPTSRTGRVVVVTGYLSAMAAPLWRFDVPGVVLALAGLGLAVASYRLASGRRQRDRRNALQVVAGIVGVLLVGALARLAAPAADVAVPLLLAYEAVLITAAARLVAGLRPPAVTTVTDLVVELGETRSAVLREAFADALRDPTVRFGYWEPSRSAYVDSAGAPIQPPVAGGGRAMTTIDRDGQPFAVLVHDAALLTDPALTHAVAATTRLTTANAELQADVSRSVDEVAASVRRIQITVDEEQRRLEKRLVTGPETSLEALLLTLQDLAGAGEQHLQRATAQLELTLAELRDIAHGLHPRELEDGLAPALAALAGRCPATVRLVVRGIELAPGRVSPEIDMAVYYVCAEALANVAKHSRAATVSIEIGVGPRSLMATVTDDGIGGADPREGRGLAGLSDRVAALGGTLSVGPGPSGGTTLSAEIPFTGPTA